VVYTDRWLLQVSVSESFRKWRLKFIDPIDLVGPRGGSKGAP